MCFASNHVLQWRANYARGVAFRPNTHVDISQWGPLLQVYLALLLPVVFILLIGLNIIVWARSRINHVFIFGAPALFLNPAYSIYKGPFVELDVRTAIDPREFFEVRTRASVPYNSDTLLLSVPRVSFPDVVLRLLFVLHASRFPRSSANYLATRLDHPCPNSHVQPNTDFLQRESVLAHKDLHEASVEWVQES